MKKYGRRKTRKTFSKRPRKTYKTKILRKKKRGPKVEVKMFQQTFGTTSFNSVITNSGDIMNLIPTILQGTRSFDRLGNKIFVKSFKVRMNIAWQQPEVLAAYGKVAIRAFIACPRYLNIGTSSTGDLANLLIVNNAPQIYDGTINAHMAPVNKDFWRVKMDKRLVMKNPVFVQTGAGPLEWNQTGRRTIVRNVFKNKTLQWATGVATPVNFPWIMMFGFSPLDNFTSGALLTTPFSVNYTIEIKFTDS
jgi:hypothetical protein